MTVLDRYAPNLTRLLQLELEDAKFAATSFRSPAVSRTATSTPSPALKKAKVTFSPSDLAVSDSSVSSGSTTPLDKHLMPCNRDVLHHFGLPAKNGSVPPACTRLDCQYGHPSRGLFNNLTPAKIRKHVETYASASVRDQLLTRLDHGQKSSKH